MTIFFMTPTLRWLDGSISIFKSTPAGTPSAYKFNNKANSQILMTMAAWPMSPLVVP